MLQSVQLKSILICTISIFKSKYHSAMFVYNYFKGSGGGGYLSLDTVAEPPRLVSKLH